MLKLQYQDDALNKAVSPEREYQIQTNIRGNSVLRDVSEYSKVGDVFGAAEVKEIVRSLYDFVGNNVTFNPDGSISETLDIGTKKTVFNSDGSITEILTDHYENKIIKKTQFNEDGSITSIVSNVESLSTDKGGNHELG